jgi:hypothetical protein
MTQVYDITKIGSRELPAAKQDGNARYRSQQCCKPRPEFSRPCNSVATRARNSRALATALQTAPKIFAPLQQRCKPRPEFSRPCNSITTREQNRITRLTFK